VSIAVVITHKVSLSRLCTRGHLQRLVDALHPAPRGRAPRPRRDRVVVIGAGMGGLAAALRLAADGCEVTVLERAAHLGGKARTIEVGGRAVDAGPTVFTMRWVFDDLFAAAGTALDDHLALTPATVLARHAWPDGTRFDLFADLERTADGIRAFAGAAEAERYRAFARQTERAYAVFRESFIEGARPGPLDVVARIGLRGLPALIAARPSANMFRAIADTLQDDRLRQLFARYATYCGSSPYQAPATLMLIAHVEQEGVWLAKGGMGALANAISDLAAKKGATFSYDSHVEQILTNGRRAAGVRISDHDRMTRDIAADVVVYNGDVHAIAAGMVETAGRKAPVDPPRGARSQSAVTWTQRIARTDFDLSVHNVFFSNDYESEFEATFKDGKAPTAPTTYVFAPDRLSPDDNETTERLFCLINAPPHHERAEFGEKEIGQCRENMIKQLSACGLKITTSPETVTATGPAEFSNRFPGSKGALYGMATHGWQASFLRPGVRTKTPGLYLAGGGVHPGPGVPMATLSGRAAAAAIRADHALI
ncbi:MAG: 1-hydroxycarotenoid 3,4-desaturase CrtD, partial [Pseudomonadota bacterium]